MTKYAVVTKSGEMTGRVVEIPEGLTDEEYQFMIDGMDLGEMDLNPLPDDYPIYLSPFPNALEMELNSTPPGLDAAGNPVQ